MSLSATIGDILQPAPELFLDALLRTNILGSLQCRCRHVDFGEPVSTSFTH